MDKKSLVVLLIASSVASSAFATNIVNKLISTQGSVAPSIVKTLKSTNQTNHPYINFSGTWIPNCGSGQGEPTVIENDANYITLDGEVSTIGRGLQGKYESNEEENRYEHNSFEWNADGSALIMKGVEISKDNKDASDMMTDISTFTLTMKNNQINLDGKIILFSDTTPLEQNIPIHCVFTKKQ